MEETSVEAEKRKTEMLHLKVRLNYKVRSAARRAEKHIVKLQEKVKKLKLEEGEILDRIGEIKKEIHEKEQKD